jgi:hypothetical protein
MKVCKELTSVNHDANVLSSLVTIPFNFKRAALFQPQTWVPPSETMVWDDDTPRRLLSQDGYMMVVTMPKLIGESGTVSCFFSQYLTKTINKKNCRI